MSKEAPSPHYIKRRDEIARLKEEADKLEIELKLRSKHSSSPGSFHDDIYEKLRANDSMRDIIRSNEQSIIHLQTTVSDFSRHVIRHNLTPNCITLGTDHKERQRVLDALHSSIIASARNEIRSSYRHVDFSQRFQYEEKFTDPETGDAIMYHRVALPLSSVASVREAYDMAIFNMKHLEMSITGRVASLALRENDDTENQNAFLNRIVVSMPDADIEENEACFSQFISSEDGDVGIIATESVAQDFLLPYKPHERSRKDVRSMMEITSSTRMRDGKMEKVILVKRSLQERLHRPQFDISDDAWDQLKESVVHVSTVDLCPFHVRLAYPKHHQS